MRMEGVTYEEQKEPEPGKKNAAETCGPMIDKTLEPMGRLITIDDFTTWTSGGHL